MRSWLFCADAGVDWRCGVGPGVVADRQPDAARPTGWRLADIGRGEQAAEPRRLDLLRAALRFRIDGWSPGTTVFGAPPALRIGWPRSPGSGGPSGGACAGKAGIVARQAREAIGGGAVIGAVAAPRRASALRLHSASAQTSGAGDGESRHGARPISTLRDRRVTRGRSARSRRIAAATTRRSALGGCSSGLPPS